MRLESLGIGRIFSDYREVTILETLSAWAATQIRSLMMRLRLAIARYRDAAYGQIWEELDL